MKKGPVALLLLITTLAPCWGTGIDAGNPELIDLLFIRRGVGVNIYTNMMNADPSISVTLVIMPGHYYISDMGGDPAVLNRLLRLYMPRQYEILIGDWDAILMREAPVGSTQFPEIIFEAKWMQWFVRAVQEEGRSFSMWGGDASWGGGGEGFYMSWGETIMDVMLPFESLGAYNPDYAGYNRPHFIDPDHPLARLPWETVGPVELLNRVDVKPGARLVAEAVSRDGQRYPWIGWWESGKGRVVGETQVFGSYGTTYYAYHDWQWFQDHLVYLVYFAVDKPIPQDVYRAHRIRQEISVYLDKASLLVSVFDFIERFGANTVELHAELDRINDIEERGERLFRQDDYDGAAEVFEEIQVEWNKLNTEAIKVKEAALYWVYLIEWFSVSAAALLAGTFLWYAMVRRGLYREIPVTRWE